MCRMCYGHAIVQTDDFHTPVHGAHADVALMKMYQNSNNIGKTVSERRAKLLHGTCIMMHSMSPNHYDAETAGRQHTGV